MVTFVRISNSLHFRGVMMGTYYNRQSNCISLGTNYAVTNVYIWMLVGSLILNGIGYGNCFTSV